jgi:hypothetical protein
MKEWRDGDWHGDISMIVRACPPSRGCGFVYLKKSMKYSFYDDI